MKKNIFKTILIVLVISVSACHDKKNNKPQEVPVTILDTIRLTPPLDRLVVEYTIDSLKTKADLDTFNTKFSKENRKTIYALNRIDARKVWAGKELVIPDTLTSNLMDYTPFPIKLGMVDTIPKTVIISQRIQAFALYEHGKLIKWGPVSSGKRTTPTPGGLHYGNYKAKRKVSSVNKSWILPYYFNFMNFEGVGTHQYTLPGYPASHACVRLYMNDAEFIYNWAAMWKLDGNQLKKNGTPFMVVGKYDYKKIKPWLQLADSMEANDFTESELNVIRDYVEEYKNDPKNFEDSTTVENDLTSVS